MLSQKWAENKRRILIITPASLRKQWSQELQEKFYLPSLLLESKSYKQAQKQGSHNPFEQPEIIICSYQFAARMVEDLMLVRWDLVVMDEAHRVRNVYKTGSKTARALRTALTNTPKILLTATPPAKQPAGNSMDWSVLLMSTHLATRKAFVPVMPD